MDIEKLINTLSDKVIAKTLGKDVTVIRPISFENPLDGDIIATKKAVITPFSGKNPIVTEAMWQIVMDRTLIRVGDYVVSGTDTFFVATRQDLLGTTLVKCNTLVNVCKQLNGGEFEVVMSNWPANIIAGGLTATNRAGIPDSASSDAGRTMMLPSFADIAVTANYAVFDAQENKYIVASSEALTEGGWRINLSSTNT